MSRSSEQSTTEVAKSTQETRENQNGFADVKLANIATTCESGLRGLPPRTRWLLGAAVIAALASVAYLPALQAGFVWDDDILLTRNPLIFQPDGWLRFWFTRDTPDYFPLTSNLLWLEYRVWGQSPVGYHLTTVLLHLANALLLWRVLARLAIPGAWLAAAVFAVHPVNVASVAWVSETKNTFSMLFYLLAILAFLEFETGGRRRSYVLALALFALGLLAKSTLVVLPLVLLLLAWWRRGRIGWRDVARAAPFFALALALGIVTLLYQARQGHMEAAAFGWQSLWTGLAVSGRAVWFYLGKLLLPVNLCAVYPKWALDLGAVSTYLPTLAVVAVAALVAWQRRTWGRPFVFAGAYFLVTLALLLGFVPTLYMQFSYVADHWLYLSGIGVIALATAGATALYRRSPPGLRSAQLGAAGLVLVALGCMTWAQAGTYRNLETLWRQTLRFNPDSPVARNNLGYVFLRRGEWEAARQEFAAAVRLSPYFSDAHLNLGLVLAELGKTEEAMAEYRLAIANKPDPVEAHQVLAMLLDKRGQTAEAELHFREAVRLRPNAVGPRRTFARFLATHRQYAAAEAELRECLRLAPNDAGIQAELAALRQRESKADQP